MSKTYAIDVPNGYDPEAAWINYDYFDTREEAIKFARHHFGADENGCICLLSEIEEIEDDHC